ncbi:unnamed protein product, partial [Ectocarpus sp. 12 AP-2014]
MGTQSKVFYPHEFGHLQHTGTRWAIYAGQAKHCLTHNNLFKWKRTSYNCTLLSMPGHPAANELRLQYPASIETRRHCKKNTCGVECGCVDYLKHVAPQIIATKSDLQRRYITRTLERLSTKCGYQKKSDKSGEVQSLVVADYN